MREHLTEAETNKLIIELLSQQRGSMLAMNHILCEFIANQTGEDYDEVVKRLAELRVYYSEQSRRSLQEDVFRLAEQDPQ